MWEKAITATIKYYKKKISELQKRIDDTKESAAKSPGAMQSWSDKSKQELSVLADALSKDLPPLKSSLKLIEDIQKSQKASPDKKIVVGSIVLTKEPGEENDEYLLIVPGVGGDQIVADNTKFFLLSENSELAKQLLGKKLENKVVLKSGAEVVISEVINS